MAPMSPRSAAANQQIKDARREALLLAARRVFARTGLAATRVSDIAAQAGVSQGLVYHYFPNKEALFAEIVEGALRETARLAAQASQRSGPAWQRIEYLCQQMLAGVRDQPEYVLVILQAFTSAAAPHQARTALADYGAGSFGDIVRLIAQGQAEGSVAAGDPIEAAIAFTACIQGLALARLEGGSGAVAFPRSETILRLLRAR
jgi:AcrR family transcriptional regulator